MTHAWLVTDSPGLGRSNTARAFVAALQCTGPVSGYGQYKPCRDVMAGLHPDVVRLAIGKLIITTEEVKILIGEAQHHPWIGRQRTISVKDADRTAERTINVLLKSVEGPPPQIVWLLRTPSANDALSTIRSHCRLATLRIPPADTAAEFLVRRDGVDPELAARVARASQSHTGLARHLTTDADAWDRCRRLLLAPVSLRNVGDVVLAAASLVETAGSEVKEVTAECGAREKAELIRVLGLESDGEILAVLRAQIHRLEEDQKRHAKRVRIDALDRAMADLPFSYCDVLTIQMGSDVERANLDLSDAADQAARMTGSEQSLACIAAIEECRSRLCPNAVPLLTVEVFMVQLRPQTEGS